MRRIVRPLILIAVLVIVSGLVLGFQKIKIGNFERGGDTPLGLSLGLDLQGGSHLVYQADLKDAQSGQSVQPTKDQMDAAQRTIERRVNASGLGEPIIQLLGNDRLLIQLPGVRDPSRAKRIIGETATLVFKHRKLNVPSELSEITAADIVGVSVSTLGDTLKEIEAAEATPTPEAAQPTPTAAPEAVPTPAATPSPADARPMIVVQFTEEGAQKFAAVLKRHTDSLLQGLGGGGQAPPSRLEIAVEGKEPLKFDLLSLSIRQIGTSARFALPYPQGQPDASGTPAPQVDVDAAKARLGDNPKIFFTEIQGALDEDIGLTGDDLARAFPSQHTASGAPIVNLEFKERGTRIFGELTTQIAGSPTDQIAIFLDNDELISPVVNSPITTGTAIIEGRDFTLERVREIALLLESGRLPVPIKLIQEREVDAILGADSLTKSVIAGFMGLGLVLLFMILYYKVPGLVAAIALLIYTAIVLAIYKIMPVTLTLSGVAATILSIGMAVDANILIFERMKEELRAGRTLLSAMNIGFNRAWLAIRDSNVAALIICVILFWFADQLGTTVVQGFAITLAIGVFVSMFSAITVSRVLLRIIAATPVSRKYGWFIPTNAADLPQLQPTTPAAQRS